jgi:hypothetical protein
MNAQFLRFMAPILDLWIHSLIFRSLLITPNIANIVPEVTLRSKISLWFVIPFFLRTIYNIIAINNTCQHILEFQKTMI